MAEAASTTIDASLDRPGIPVSTPAHHRTLQIYWMTAPFAPDIQNQSACVSVAEDSSDDGTLDAVTDAPAANASDEQVSEFVQLARPIQVARLAAKRRLRVFPLHWREPNQASSITFGRMCVQLARNVLFYLFLRDDLPSQDGRAGARDYAWDLIAGGASYVHAKAAA